MRGVLTRLVALLAAAFAGACAQRIPPPVLQEPVSRAAPPPEQAWSQVLMRFVNANGRVDFSGLLQDRRDLNRYVAAIAEVGPEQNPDLFSSRNAVLAYHLNAYNALAMYGVLEAGIPPTLAGAGKLRFFYLTRYRIGGVEMSLYDYENKVIRALGEPRAHFALNCMSESCPRLPRAPFRAPTLDAELERETRLFFNDPRNVRVDDAGRRVYLSEILDFYTEDFLAVAPSLLAYVNRYRDKPVPEDYAVGFIPYDWTVVSQ